MSVKQSWDSKLCSEIPCGMLLLVQVTRYWWERGKQKELDIVEPDGQES